MFGEPRYHFPLVDSTNRAARDLARSGVPEGTLVTADFQTAGRGRRERRWFSEKGRNILASYVLRPSRPREESSTLPLLAGVAVAETVFQACGLQVSLKWPNDVLAGDAKLAGILVESVASDECSAVIVGIGVNVNQPVFPQRSRPRPVSLRGLTGREWPLEDLLAILSRTFEKRYVEWCSDGPASVLAAWRERSTMLGRMVWLSDDHAARRVCALDILEDGSLLVVDENGNRTAVYAGDVSLSLPAKGER
ncbi:MAG: biotin--[acetyl-CoA-carboxylase] ligase [Bacteroidota bacterium]|nr:biotin--[acetyl-CoA-carboxylase] ligase [Bacteroidota bacterium]